MRPPADATVFLCREPIDFRKGISGLAILVEQALDMDAFADALYVFVNKSRTAIKILGWERAGFCLWQKRLEKDHFVWPRHLEGDTVTLSGQELNWLLDGFDLWANKPHQLLKFASVS